MSSQNPSPFGAEEDPRIRSHEYLNVSWEMFGELCRALALKVGRDERPEAVVGIARAGVIPAAIIASLLRIDFHSIKISRKAGEHQIRERPEVLSAAPQAIRGKRVLLVDEITTSGDTFRLGLAALRDVGAKEIRTASVFVRPKGFAADYHALETDTTVIFPWDLKVFDGDDWVVNPMYRGVVDDV
jgi:hypoxanthine phosphoribosyltransferase